MQGKRDVYPRTLNGIFRWLQTAVTLLRINYLAK